MAALRNKRFRVINYLDIAPLIDCVLLLLIFFLLTSSFISQDQKGEDGFSVDLPKAAFASDLSDNTLAIYVGRNEKIYLNGKTVGYSELRAAFLSSKKSVVIKADQTVRLKKVTAIMDLARSCNIEKLSIATVKPDEK